AMQHFGFLAQIGQFAVKLQGMATLTLALIGDREETLAAWLRDVAVGADHRLVAEGGKPVGNEVGGMRKNEVGVVDWLDIVAEIDFLKAPFRGVADEGHAE